MPRLPIIDLTSKSLYAFGRDAASGVSIWVSEFPEPPQVGQHVLVKEDGLVRNLIVANLDGQHVRLTPDTASKEERRIRSHVHDGKLIENYYTRMLISVCPEIVWAFVEDVGDYQGNVFGTALYLKKKCGLFFSGSYGSCSGCGAWGEGGEPTTQSEVLSLCTEFRTLKGAAMAIEKETYDRPTTEKHLEAAGAVLKEIRKLKI